MLTPIRLDEREVRRGVTAMDESGANHVFMVLHGFYGNLFLSKFQTGTPADPEDPDSEDAGIANARRIWAYRLKNFDAQTIRAALRQCEQRHAEFPPSLPEFAALCEANRPRETFRSALPAIPMGQTLRSKYAAQARAINAKHAAVELVSRTGYIEFMPGLAGLKQAISSAVGAAGGDEAAELVRLDRLLTPATRTEKKDGTGAR